MEPDAARVAPRANAEVPPHPVKMYSNPGLEALPFLYNKGTKMLIPGVDTAPHGVETPTPLAGC